MVEEDRIDWGTAEALAIGSLLIEGYHVRLSGQDTSRGTFSHRHARIHDYENGNRYVPLQHLDPGQGRFEVIDTMLSEAAVLGFEYGYSTADPMTLVIWEAQFGDFANVAQVYIDQFIASAESKWRRMSGVTLLLPHGYEGQGPEHSSARLERFLEPCANGSLQVCNFTTPAQMFHALRRQMHRKFRKPLVVMSPKSLLRHKRAVSSRRDFTAGTFQPVLDDAAVSDPRAVRRVILGSGRIFYALDEARGERRATDVALVRLEQLYPFPRREVEQILARYRRAEVLRWVQEEPGNMGAWRHLRHRFESALPLGMALEKVSRPDSSTPATGYYQKHVEEERNLIEGAFAEHRADPALPPFEASPGARREASR
jgi:2-oxoglutarate dehydrogenase E1 component